MSKLGIFRDELPGEKKTIINLVTTGYLVAMCSMGYVAFYMFIQLAQIKRVLDNLDQKSLSPEEFSLLRDRLFGSLDQMGNEVMWLVGVGILICIIGGAYTYNLLIKPLRKMVQYVESGGQSEMPEFKSNHELKQLATGILDLQDQANPDAVPPEPSLKESS